MTSKRCTALIGNDMAASTMSRLRRKTRFALQRHLFIA